MELRVNESPDTDTWTSLSATSVDVQRGQGVDGSDRITLVWPDRAIVNRWVEVTVKSDASGGGLGLADDDLFYFANAVADSDCDGEVGVSDYATLIGEFGQSGDGLVTDFNVDGRVDLYDFVTLRGMYGNSVSVPTFPPAAHEASAATPATTLQTTVEPIAAASTPVVPIVSQPLNDNNDVSDGSIVAVVSAPTIDLLVEPSADYVPRPQPISIGSLATTPYRAATAEYDLRPLGDDLVTDGQPDDLLADILTESALALPL